ncbi:apolipoprotein N-acyltransferase [Helicobacter sp. 12S02634-8]|nr:apolipoprotein N-acyltransferase [Helicobacter sp. 12S02634-8]
MYRSQFSIINAFFAAVIFLIPVYGAMLFLAQDLSVGALVVQSIFAPIAIAIWLYLPKKASFWFGFLVGLGLFYWVGLSLRFSMLGFLIPFVMVLVALVYGVIFYCLLFYQNLVFRIASLLLMGYIHPFGFDWLTFKMFFSYSIFGIDNWSFFCLILGVGLVLRFRRYYKLLGVGLLVMAVSWSGYKGQDMALALEDIAVTSTHVNQDFKWQSQNIEQIIGGNLEHIYQAIAKGKKIIILPETAFPFALNQSDLMGTLKNLSYSITIITGALRAQDKDVYNSTYIFEKGKFSYADKVILAPFGEEIPLPDFLAKPIYREFFGGEMGLSAGREFKHFIAEGLEFTPAICYEGTSERTYAHHPKYMILMSNNGWFVPSIEPFLQRLLIKYYARAYGTIVIHSANQSSAYVVSPNILGDIAIKS